MHKLDKFILPTCLVVPLLGLIFYLSNYKMYQLPEKRVLMKPAFGPQAVLYTRYWGAEKLRGDRSQAIEFAAPDGGMLISARVIAVEGQTVEVRDEKVYVDGQVLVEPYLRTARTRPEVAPILIPRRTAFVLCDERTGRGASSFDSRYYGPIPIECVTRIFSVSTEAPRREKS